MKLREFVEMHLVQRIKNELENETMLRGTEVACFL